MEVPMIKSVQKAAYATSDKGYHFIRLVTVLFLAILVFSLGKGMIEQFAPIYKKPWNFQWEVKDGDFIFQALSQKVLPCSVVPGSSVDLAVTYRTAHGDLVPKGYSAREVFDEEVLVGRPLVRTGDSFVVGPWRFREEVLRYKDIQAISIVLQCRFPSGVEREAVIGPMEPGEKG